jgi:hypothetical protein
LKVCSVDGCNKKHEAKGYCKKHYNRFRRYGDPLIEPKIRHIDDSQRYKIIDNVKHKFCLECNEYYPMNEEYFHENSSNKKDGFNSYCKECTRKRSLKVYWSDVEKGREHSRQWARENKARHRILKRKWHVENATYSKQIQAIWRKENKDRVKHYNEQRVHKNHNINNEEWDNCKKYFNYSCAYCGLPEEKHKELFSQRLHKEHVDHEGLNDLSNCVPACKSCNGSKHTFELEEWYNEENPIFNEKRLQKIYRWLDSDYKLYVQKTNII